MRKYSRTIVLKKFFLLLNNLSRHGFLKIFSVFLKACDWVNILTPVKGLSEFAVLAHKFSASIFSPFYKYFKFKCVFYVVMKIRNYFTSDCLNYSLWPLMSCYFKFWKYWLQFWSSNCCRLMVVFETSVFFIIQILW